MELSCLSPPQPAAKAGSIDLGSSKKAKSPHNLKIFLRLCGDFGKFGLKGPAHQKGPARVSNYPKRRDRPEYGTKGMRSKVISPCCTSGKEEVSAWA